MTFANHYDNESRRLREDARSRFPDTNALREGPLCVPPVRYSLTGIDSKAGPSPKTYLERFTFFKGKTS